VPTFIAQNKETLDAIKIYADNIEEKVRQNLGFFLYGKPGLAKTGMGCLVLKAAIDRGIPAAFINLPVWMRRHYDAMDNAVEQERLSLDRVWLKKEVDLLVVDAIDGAYGVQDETKWAAHQLNAFYNDVVYNTNKSVILTANIPQDKLFGVVPIDVVDRISELAAFELVGTSFRKSESNASKKARLIGQPFKLGKGIKTRNGRS
jgi:DNA replication protein DnaC